MLVSHSHKFILIKTHKTAGSSIEEYLKPFCEQNGIIETRKYNSHWPAREIKKLVGEEVWSAYTKICPVRNPWDKMVSLYFWRRRKRPWSFHLKRLLRGETFYTPEQRLSFEKYIKSRGNGCNIDREKMFITHEWEDYFFIRFEHLHDDLNALADHLDIPYKEKNLPKEKVGYRPNKEYREYYTPETRAIVARAFQPEIEKFGYEF